MVIASQGGVLQMKGVQVARASWRRRPGKAEVAGRQFHIKMTLSQGFLLGHPVMRKKTPPVILYNLFARGSSSYGCLRLLGAGSRLRGL